jgi:nucleotide-binding universal stress UspA family protein
MFELIVVAVDGSDHSNRALGVALEMAECFGSEIWLVHAYRHVSDLYGYNEYEQLIAKRKGAGQAILNDARQLLGETTVEVSEELLEEPAAEAILSVANARQAGLIVMGTRGRSTLTGLLFGTTSSKVAQYADCPVMLIR